MLEGRYHRNLLGFGVVEFEVSGHAGAAQGLFHGGHHGLEQQLLLLELDFGLGGVNVHVNGGGIHFQVDEIGGRDAFRHQVFVGFHHGLVQVGAAEVSAVHKEELVAQGLAGAFGLSYITAQGGDAGIGPDIYQATDKRGPQQVLDAEFMAFGGLHHVDVLAVVA